MRGVGWRGASPYPKGGGGNSARDFWAGATWKVETVWTSLLASTGTYTSESLISSIIFFDFFPIVFLLTMRTGTGRAASSGFRVKGISSNAVGAIQGMECFSAIADMYLLTNSSSALCGFSFCLICRDAIMRYELLKQLDSIFGVLIEAILWG